jgi:hypothetical protein
MSKNIHCTAYSCLGGHNDSPINGHTNLTNDPVILKLASLKQKTPAQILYASSSPIRSKTRRILIDEMQIDVGPSAWRQRNSQECDPISN